MARLLRTILVLVAAIVTITIVAEAQSSPSRPSRSTTADNAMTTPEMMMTTPGGFGISTDDEQNAEATDEPMMTIEPIDLRDDNEHNHESGNGSSDNESSAPADDDNEDDSKSLNDGRAITDNNSTENEMRYIEFKQFMRRYKNETHRRHHRRHHHHRPGDLEISDESTEQQTQNELNESKPEDSRQLVTQSPNRRLSNGFGLFGNSHNGPEVFGRSRRHQQQQQGATAATPATPATAATAATPATAATAATPATAATAATPATAATSAGTSNIRNRQSRLFDFIPRLFSGSNASN